MKALAALLVCVFSAGSIAIRAQAPATAPPTPAAARPNPNPTDVAGIPVNYDEAKVGSYSLADPLVFDSGKKVRDAKTWYGKRRPEIVEVFETQQYGRAPGR